MGQIAEAAVHARRSLAVAREVGYPAGEARALVALGIAAYYASDYDGAIELARQARQIPGDIPGWIVHAGSNILTLALIAAGDLAAAERSCAAMLAQVRDADDLLYQRVARVNMASLDVQAGRIADATSNLREALQIAVRSGDQLDVSNCLDCCVHLCAATGRHAETVTIWAAYAALMRQTGLTDPPADARRRQEPLDRARHALGRARARAAEDRGAAMTVTAAIEYVLMLTAPGPQPGVPPGPAGLSARERELVTLVAQGRTDAQIAAQLYISVRTVRSHLDRIRDKTGSRRRADLTRLALTAGLV
jgi:DNA-binding CsgD family transcriptional regulator